MESIGYSSYFTKIEQFKEGSGDNLDIPEVSFNQALNDMEKLLVLMKDANNMEEK